MTQPNLQYDRVIFSDEIEQVIISKSLREQEGRHILPFLTDKLTSRLVLPNNGHISASEKKLISTKSYLFNNIKHLSESCMLWFF